MYGFPCTIFDWNFFQIYSSERDTLSLKINLLTHRFFPLRTKGSCTHLQFRQLFKDYNACQLSLKCTDVGNKKKGDKPYTLLYLCLNLRLYL